MRERASPGAASATSPSAGECRRVRFFFARLAARLAERIEPRLEISRADVPSAVDLGRWKDAIHAPSLHRSDVHPEGASERPGREQATPAAAHLFSS